MTYIVDDKLLAKKLKEYHRDVNANYLNFMLKQLWIAV